MKYVALLLFLAFNSMTFSQETPPEEVQMDTFQEDIPSEPEFPGGTTAMMEFIAKNTRYPQSAMLNNEQGRVFVQFVVEKDGSITNAEIMRGVSEALDKEAMRVVQSMPNWIPGESNGKKVRTRQIIPISFRLD